MFVCVRECAHDRDHFSVFMLEFSISASLSRQFFPVSTDVESDSCGICVASPRSRFVHSPSIPVFIFKKKKN